MRKSSIYLPEINAFVFYIHVLVCLLQAINKAIQKPHEEFSIGVLDIYGFEIFKVCTLLLVLK